MQTKPLLQPILNKLRNVKQAGEGFSAQCPAHEDNRNSLSVSIGDDSRVLLCCHAGCTTNAICDALGVDLKDLFPLKEKLSNKKIVATYNYTDESEKLLFQKARYEPKDFRCRVPDGKGGWKWKMAGVRKVLYRLPAVIQSSIVFVAEGEKDCDALAKYDLVATCNFDGAGKWDSCYNPFFKDKVVYIIPDNDDAGRNHAAHIFLQLKAVAADCKILELPGLPEKGDVSDFFASGGTVQQLGNIIANAPDGLPESFQTLKVNLSDVDAESRDAWNPVVPFEDLDLPVFPLDAVPACLSTFAQIVREVSSSHQTPYDMAALLLMTIASACLGGRVKIITNNRYTELVTLFLSIFAPSGTRKSSVYHSLMMPVIEHQKRLRAQMRAEIVGNRNELDILKRQIEKLMKDIVKANDEERDVLQEQLKEKEESLAKFEKPTELPLIFMETDFTVESLAPKINANGGTLALFDHEGAFWNEVAGRYTQTQSQTNDLILKSYDGHPVTVSRVGRGDIFIEHCCLAIGLIVQPTKIEDLKNRKMLEETGLIPRFILSVPTDNIGYRQMQTPAVPHYVYADYNATIEKLFDLREQGEIVLSMDDPTATKFIEYCESIETRLREGQDLYAMRAWASKLTGRVARIAAVLHCYAHPCTIQDGQTIDEQIMDYAIGLSPYLVAHAKATYQILNLSVDVKIARKILRTLENYTELTGSTQISKGELWGRIKNSDKSIQTVTSIAEALDILIDHNYIRQVDAERKPGRPSEIYELNPDYFSTP